MGVSIEASNSVCVLPVDDAPLGAGLTFPTRMAERYARLQYGPIGKVERLITK